MGPSNEEQNLESHSLPSRPEVRKFRALLTSIDPWVLERQMEITSIPAPPFQEELRGRRMAELFREVGLRDVRTDEIGNVLGEFPTGGDGGVDGGGNGGTAASPLIVSAHLDTVFPPGTDVTPTMEGDRIAAPGISDDGRGLAALLAMARVLKEAEFHLPFPILFVATVGEEGPGDLRGVRHLFSIGGQGAHAKGFISLDGFGMDRVINRGVGSTRLRITVKGPGGHSWTDFGLPNPIHGLGRIISRTQNLPLPVDPKTTLSFARWAGGTSINSIPQEAWVEVDLRSESGQKLAMLEEELIRICREEVEEDGGKTVKSGRPRPDAGKSLRPGRLGLEIQEIGRRPAGYTKPTLPLVEAALEATRALGEEPVLVSSSTDANVPMSLGIPSITLGAGGVGGGIHTTEEWYQNEKGPEGILRALLTLLLIH